MKTPVLTLLALLLVPATGLAQGEIYAIRGGTVHTLAGPTIDGGTVVLQDGRVTAVGADVSVPAGATVIDATGQHVYPGLFNAFSQLGLREINAIAMTVDVQELGDFNPHLTASTAVNPASEHIPVTRANGVTHVVAAPSARAGGIGGQASVIGLDGWTIEEMLIGQVGFVLNWPSLQTRSFDFTTFSVVNRSFEDATEEYEQSMTEMRGWFENARQYQQAVAAGAAVRDLRLEALGKALSGEMPVLVLADEARDIEKAVEFAEAEGLRIVIVGGRDATEVKDLLAEKEIPVLLRATQNTPAERDDPYYTTFSAAAELHTAGVRLAMTGWGSAGPNPPSRTVAYEAANAVKFGLPEEEALLMITRYPAEILGLGDRLGTIEPGKLGNLIVTDGNPLQIRTQIVHVLINGHPVSLDNKHRDLYEKYRARR
jgi:imidazolonepropionase-like amidohydrolase